MKEDEFFEDFSDVDHPFKVFIEFSTILLHFLYLFLGHKAFGILAPRPYSEPIPSVLKDEVSTTGPPEKSPKFT